MTFESSDIYTPYSIQSEQACIASLLCGGEIALVSGLIAPQDFYDGINGYLFECMVNIDKKNRDIDVESLFYEIENGSGNKSEAMKYITEVAASTALPQHCETYARQVKDYSNERQVLTAAGEMINIIKRGSGSSSERITDAMAVFNAIDTEEHEQKHMKEQVAEFLTDMEKKMEVKTEVTGMPTGLDDLDKVTGGFQDNDFVIMGARPAMGKTTLGVNAIVQAAKGLVKNNEDGLVMIFSMEMSANQLIGRMFAAEGGIRMNSIKAPGLFFGRDGCAGGEGYNAAAGKIMPLMNNIVIDDRPALTHQQVRAACLSAERKYGKKVRGVLVDYVQIMGGPGEKTPRVAANSMALKALAMELKCPVITLAQLNRDVEKRNDKRPMSSDLKDSGQLEQDADIIILIHSDDESDEIDRKAGNDEGYALLIIDKFRAGVCQDVLVKKELSYSRFRTNDGY
jgi:replicative DNA helicase